MGGIFGVATKEDCIYDLFFGIDYHSHLGTRRGGMAVYGKDGFEKAIHNIENAPFRTKFQNDVVDMSGHLGIGCISDNEPQPLIVRAHFGNFVITTVGRINNADELLQRVLKLNRGQFMEMSLGRINPTELIASIISAQDNLIEGIKRAQELVEGSLTMLVMTEKGIYASRDLWGRTPLIIGKKSEGYAISFESFAYHNLGYTDDYELGPGEIVFVTPNGYESVAAKKDKMKICTFLWVYYGYPTSSYEGVNVEEMRYRCGEKLAARDTDCNVDYVCGVPDSGNAHAVGFSNVSRIPYGRPLIKYTPTWPRSFMTLQSQRQMTADMKLISIGSLIKGKKLLFIDDSIVRGTQTKKMADSLFSDGAKEVHVRSACPPVMFGCKYLNFSRSTSEYELITRRVIKEREGSHDNEKFVDYVDSFSTNHKEMIDTIGKKSRFTSLKYNNLEDMLDSVSLDKCKLCTYCWDGKE